jgi:hypothetical protein
MVDMDGVEVEEVVVVGEVRNTYRFQYINLAIR